MLVELKGYSLQQACDEVIKKRNKNKEIGVIAINKQGDMGISFNTEIMKCACKSSDKKEGHIRVYKDTFIFDILIIYSFYPV